MELKAGDRVMVQKLSAGTVQRIFDGIGVQVRLDEPVTPKSGVPWQVGIFAEADLEELSETASARPPRE